jgi:hypothetical protein
MIFDTLFISASFFGYAHEIAAAMELRGRKVLRFEDRPAVDTLSKAIVRIDPRLAARAMERYFKTIMEAARAHPIRDVLVIKGEALSVSMIQRLRTALPHACFTLYFWDSYRNMPRGTAGKVSLFDLALSFDPEDVRADPRLSYRPLFFLPQFGKLPKLDQNLDLVFIGTIHSDRYRVLKRLQNTIPPERSFDFRMYYPSRRLFAIRRIVDPRFWGASEREFIFTPLGREVIIRLVARAKIAVDIERPVQAGFTMRMIEMMGSQRKIITTNPNIVNADFYHPHNVAVIDRLNPTMSNAFLDTPFAPLRDDILHRYSLDGWLDEILPGSNPITQRESLSTVAGW